MQADFHYYATYCAALLAGYTPQESRDISYCDQMADCCSTTMLETLGAPLSAATTQLKLEMMKVPTDPVGLQDITRIWAAFHFLPYDLAADPGKGGKSYRDKYRLICRPNGALVVDTIELARNHGTQAAGLAVHILADTWAHQNFAGTPSLVINNISGAFTELVERDDGSFEERDVQWHHNPVVGDDFDGGRYINSIYQADEDTIMNLGHGRVGHLPDYSFARYRYAPAWGDYKEIVKDNPSDYWHAFCQVLFALRCLREGEAFELHRYDFELAAPWEANIKRILAIRQLDSSDDWRELGTRICGVELEPFDAHAFDQEYLSAPKERKDETFLGSYFTAALAQKSMVTKRIYESGNLLAGRSIQYDDSLAGRLGDYAWLLKRMAQDQMREIRQAVES